jgi:hypothetical protein
VLSNVAVLAAVTPAGAPQGTVQALSFTGSTFQPGIALKVSGNGKNATLNAASVTATSLTATIDVTGWDVGTYAITATNVGAAASNGVGFAVTPGKPTVAGVSPATLSQASGTKAVTISGTNFAAGTSGSTVHASSPTVQGGLEFVLPTTGVTVSSVASAAITLSVDPTALVPATYTLWVVNPGATGPQVSGTATLTVTP